MRRRPVEPLAFWTSAAFALLGAASLALLASLALAVVRGAWPGPLLRIGTGGKASCAEVLESSSDGLWVRISGRSDAWFLPPDSLRGAVPDPALGAVLLRDGRWHCTDRAWLESPQGPRALPPRDLARWIDARRSDLETLRQRSLEGDSVAGTEFRRLHLQGTVLRVRLSLGTDQRELPLESLRSVRPDHLSAWERCRLFASTLREQLASPPSSFASLAGTVLVTVLATVLASPLALAAAVWLSEFATPGPLAWTFRQSVQLLSGIPPVVFGVFGLAVLIREAGPALAPQAAHPSLLWASLTLTFLALPTVTRQAHRSLLQVPAHLREASLCAGASRLQTLRRIVLPACRKGLWSAVLMGAIQALAETSPLLLTGAVQLAGRPLLGGGFPWIHPGGGFEHLGTRLFHGIEQLPPGPLEAGATALCCLLLALTSIALRTWAASLRHPEDPA